MSFSPARAANSAPQNALAGFAGPLRGEEREEKMEGGRERKGEIP